jgi:hypothetical protein
MREMTMNRVVVSLIAATGLLLIAGCGDGIERKDPPTKSQLEAKIEQVKNDPQMSPMAKKMTIQTLQNQESNNAQPIKPSGQ